MRSAERSAGRSDVRSGEKAAMRLGGLPASLPAEDRDRAGNAARTCLADRIET